MAQSKYEKTAPDERVEFLKGLTAENASELQPNDVKTMPKNHLQAIPAKIFSNMDKETFEEFHDRSTELRGSQRDAYDKRYEKEMLPIFNELRETRAGNEQREKEQLENKARDAQQTQRLARQRLAQQQQHDALLLNNDNNNNASSDDEPTNNGAPDDQGQPKTHKGKVSFKVPSSSKKGSPVKFEPKTRHSGKAIAFFGLAAGGVTAATLILTGTLGIAASCGIGAGVLALFLLVAFLRGSYNLKAEKYEFHNHPPYSERALYSNI